MGRTFCSRNFLIAICQLPPGESQTSEPSVVHLFTPQEANKLLPDIKPKVRRLIELKRAGEELQREADRYKLIGFMTAELAEKVATVSAYADRINTGVDELEDLGVLVKELDMGLVDFPAEKYGEVVYLCWRYGEPEVSFWHSERGGYSTRQPVKIQMIQP